MLLVNKFVAFNIFSLSYYQYLFLTVNSDIWL